MGIRGLYTLIRKYVLPCYNWFEKSDIKDIVIDGSNLVNEIFLQDNIPDLERVCDTSFLVNEVLRVLNNLENYGLRIVKIFLDSMKESEKMNTLLERRGKNIRRINAFWESDLLLKKGIKILSTCRSILIEAIIEKYGDDIIEFCGIDCDKDIARYAKEHNTLVLTGDSDFCIFDIPGVVFLDDVIRGRNISVMTRDLILSKLSVDEFQLFFLIYLQGNDFSDGRNPGNVQNLRQTLEYVQANAPMELRFTDSNYGDVDLTPIKEQYSLVNEVPYPFNMITAEVSEMESFADLGITEELLKKACDILNDPRLVNIHKIVFSPIQVAPLIHPVEYKEQIGDVITPIERKIYALLGDDPFYKICGTHCLYYTKTNGEWSYEVADGTSNYSRENNMYIVKHRIDKLISFGFESIADRVKLLNYVFDKISQKLNNFDVDKSPDNKEYVVQLAEYILASIWPKEKDFIHDMIISVLDHHDDNHPVEENAEALFIQDRKFVFTVFFVLSLSNSCVSNAFTLLQLPLKTRLYRHICYSCLCKHYAKVKGISNPPESAASFSTSVACEIYSFFSDFFTFFF